MNNKTDPKRQPWRSVGFWLACSYGFLVTITMIATVSIIYVQTVGVMYQGMTRQIVATSKTFEARFEHGGRETLIQDIERELSDDRNAATELFLYLDPQGFKLAGNLDQLPSILTNDLLRGDRRLVTRGGNMVRAYVISQVMPDGSRLILGQDLHDQEVIESLVLRGITSASVFAAILLIGGLFVFRQGLDRSVDILRRTLLRVAAGEIKERVEPLGQDDEFALLGNDINKMLDRIEVLMNGVRHVSDTIAHNLRTPLTRILLQLRHVAAQTDITAVQRKNIEKAVIDIEELISVFEKLLQIADAEAGTQRIHFQALVLSSVISEVLDFYGTVAEANGIQLLFTPAEGAPVMGDPDLIAGALANVVDNALKYGREGSTIMIKDEATRDHVLLTVSDNGPGIPEKDLTQLGTRFFRLDRSVSGHGLGLASVAAVMALHGGRLWFDDAKPGLVVCMEFPRHRA